MRRLSDGGDDDDDDDKNDGGGDGAQKIAAEKAGAALAESCFLFFWRGKKKTGAGNPSTGRFRRGRTMSGKNHGFCASIPVLTSAAAFSDFFFFFVTHNERRCCVTDDDVSNIVPLLCVDFRREVLVSVSRAARPTVLDGSSAGSRQVGRAAVAAPLSGVPRGFSPFFLPPFFPCCFSGPFLRLLLLSTTTVSSIQSTSPAP